MLQAVRHHHSADLSINKPFADAGVAAVKNDVAAVGQAKEGVPELVDKAAVADQDEGSTVFGHAEHL